MTEKIDLSAFQQGLKVHEHSFIPIEWEYFNLVKEDSILAPSIKIVPASIQSAAYKRATRLFCQSCGAMIGINYDQVMQQEAKK